MLHRILCSLDKNYFLVTRVSDSCSYQKARWEKCPSYNICLIGRNKEREEHFPQPHMPYYTAPTHEDRWCFHYAKDPGNSSRSQMKDQFWFLLTGIFGITFDRTTEICLSVFDKPVLCPASLTCICNEFGKGIKIVRVRFPLVSSVL